ncbi:hypothetical protein J7E83_11460 [Arthrobacter sp. ISL-48]|uniref:hypothetical protein n=1 Tax=Arthrobacter sp. ISL-48 TaxID=2819110 RepID=UPI001BEA0665|nr:hypothetical protein [Arthrobacter sp. ISL-48]MBT2532730.1 hypothetical protein [Arthrobacter sp. ISL-48]
MKSVKTGQGESQGGCSNHTVEHIDFWWDDAKMSENSENKDQSPQEQSQRQEGYAVSPTTQQLRTVGQRRRDAEEKLEHHLEEARHKEHLHDEDASNEDAGAVDSGDVAAIQNDDSLTAADRVDMIANQVVPEAEAGEGKHESDDNP